MYKKIGAWFDEYKILNKFSRVEREPADYGSKRVLFTETRRTLFLTEVSAGNIIRMIRTSWPTVGAPYRLCGLSSPPPFAKYRAKYDFDRDHNQIIRSRI